MDRIGVMGGTFDPIHRGHLAVAGHARRVLGLEQLRLLPSASPPHRAGVQASPGQRLKMAELAVSEYEDLVVDDREYRRPGPSFMVDTLGSLRRERPDAALVLVLGMDSFVSLPAWHRWSEIFELAHLFVVSRPGEALPGQGKAREVLSERRVLSPEALFRARQGGILISEELAIPVSATAIRERLAEGRAIDDLLPRVVAEWIHEQKLYTHSTPTGGSKAIE